VVVDPANTVANQNIVQPAAGDGVLYSSTYGPLVGAFGLLLNAGGNTDRQRAAVGTVGIPAVNTEGTKPTYSCAVFAFAPVATPTDFWQIIGSVSKTIRVLRISVSGLSTSGGTVPLILYKRSTANTSGTLNPQTAIPHNSGSSPATAVVNTYSASNPTPGTGSPVRASELVMAASGTFGGSVVWEFSTRNDQAMVLSGTAQSLDLNLNGTAVPGGGVLTIDVEWTEE